MLDTATFTENAPPLPSITLRDYQETCVQRVLDAYQRQPHGGSALIVLPTGGGKTIVFTEIARRLGLTTLIIAHREELLRQAAEKFRMVDPTAIIGQVGAGLHEWGAPITVASVQTISRPEHLKALRRFGYQLVIIDECHHSMADGYLSVLKVLSDAFLVGVTATPDRLDRQDISRIFGEPVFSASIVDMVEQGYLCDLRAIAVKTTISLDSLHTQAGDFKQDELEELVDTEERNERVVRAYLEHASGRQALCFAVTVAHAQHLAETFARFKVRAAMVCGETPQEERRRLLHAYEHGEIDVLCNVGVLTEGYDCLDEKTEILTPEGWRGRGQVKQGDLVYSLNRETMAIEATPVLAYVERDVQIGERMVTLQSQHVDIRTTEGHEFHIKYRDPAKKGALSNTWLTKTGYELAQRRSSYALPLSGEIANLPGVPLTDDEIRFIAWFMTDGGFSPTSSVTISQAKAYHYEIRALLDRLGLDYTERLKPPSLAGSAGERALPLYEFRIPKGTDKAKPRNGWQKYAPYLDKNVSPLLHAMTREQFIVFWKELLKGDGSLQGNKAGWLWCNRKTQVDAYTYMAVVRGFATSYNEGQTSHGTPIWRVTIRDTQWLTSDPRDTRSARIQLETPRQGEKVWCVRNKNSTLVTRRNGKVVIIGNCPQTSCIILARPTQSRALFVQMVGRGTRLAPGKRDCIILDITDNCLKHRLQPVTLSQALGRMLLDRESVLEAKVRAEEEREKGQFLGEREQQERRAKVTRRAQDLLINLLAPMDWKRRANGAYYLEVGERKHRIALIPSEETEGYYTVKAALAPDYTWQTWLPHAPLEWAQQHAEMKAKLLQSDEKKRILVDSNAPWRAHPASIKQCYMLRKFGIEHKPDITAGEASDLIGKAIHERNQAKAKKKLAQLQRGETPRKRGRRASA